MLPSFPFLSLPIFIPNICIYKYVHIYIPFQSLQPQILQEERMRGREGLFLLGNPWLFLSVPPLSSTLERVYIYFFFLTWLSTLGERQRHFDAAAETNNLEPFKLSGGDPVRRITSTFEQQQRSSEDGTQERRIRLPTCF